MFGWWKTRACKKAEEILEQNARLSAAISEALAETKRDVTTIFDRRHAHVPVPMERRKAHG